MTMKEECTHSGIKKHNMYISNALCCINIPSAEIPRIATFPTAINMAPDLHKITMRIYLYENNGFMRGLPDIQARNTIP